MPNLIDRDALMSELVEWSLTQYPKPGDKRQFYKHRGIAETMQKIWGFPLVEIPPSVMHMHFGECRIDPVNGAVMECANGESEVDDATANRG